MPKKKTSARTPKPRHVWAINPKTRVTPSRKKAVPQKSKMDLKSWVDELFD